jgi:hypothetical protein
MGLSTRAANAAGLLGFASGFASDKASEYGYF